MSMLKFLFGLIIGSLVLTGVTIVGGLTYLGVTPLSKYVGTGQQDLGITVTKAETQAAMQKIGTEIISLPANTPDDQGFKLEGKKAANFTMDGQELSAHSNNRPWKNYPLKNVQIKILADGTIESSAMLIIDKAIPYAMGLGYSEAQIRDAMKKYSIPPISVPIYIKGKGSVTDNQALVAATTVKIGAITVPQETVEQANTAASVVLSNLMYMQRHAFDCESLTFNNGQMQFKGSVAAKEYVVSK